MSAHDIFCVEKEKRVKSEPVAVDESDDSTKPFESGIIG